MHSAAKLAVLLLVASLAPAGTFLTGTTDGGQTWTDIEVGPSDVTLLNFQASPDNSSLYAIFRDSDNNYGVTISRDGGQTWRAASLRIQQVIKQMAVAPSDPQTIYVAVETSGAVVFYKSTDGGDTFDRIDGAKIDNAFNLYFNVALAVDPNSPATLYAGFSTDDNCPDDSAPCGLHKSLDGGQSWLRLSKGVFNGLLLDPSDSSVLYAHGIIPVGGLSTFKSTDGGQTWDRHELGCDVVALVMDVADRAVLFATCGNGSVWKSADGMASWTLLLAAVGSYANPLPPPGTPFRHPLMFAANRSRVYGTFRNLVVGQPNGLPLPSSLLRSDDGGESWTTVLERPTLGFVNVSRDSPNGVIARGSR